MVASGGPTLASASTGSLHQSGAPQPINLRCEILVYRTVISIEDGQAIPVSFLNQFPCQLGRSRSYGETVLRRSDPRCSQVSYPYGGRCRDERCTQEQQKVRDPRRLVGRGSNTIEVIALLWIDQLRRI